MPTFLTPDETALRGVGGRTLVIKRKVVSDGLRAEKDVADYVRKGQPMKPCAKLGGGTGKPLGITVHNTDDIKVAAGTNAAEQYCRATYNGNMRGVVVHYYVWKNEIWQLLETSERGWHATDGNSRRAGQRAGLQIGGNLDTIAIEAIGPSTATEATTAVLCARLCVVHGLDPATDIYQHNYFYPAKACPAYIRPHWGKFLADVAGYFNGKDTPKPAPGENTHKVVQGDTMWSLAVRYLGDGNRWREIAKLNGIADGRKIPVGKKIKIPGR
jgi:N-acetylmuramoyl-L-alanine amidase CwlA